VLPTSMLLPLLLALPPQVVLLLLSSYESGTSECVCLPEHHSKFCD
jgi:hypothetical protein